MCSRHFSWQCIEKSVYVRTCQQIPINKITALGLREPAGFEGTPVALHGVLIPTGEAIDLPPFIKIISAQTSTDNLNHDSLPNWFDS